MDRYYSELTRLFSLGYEEILRANLDNGSFVAIKKDMDNVTFESINNDTITNWFKQIVLQGHIFETDIEKFLNFVSVERLKDKFNKKQYFHTLKYRWMFSKDNMQWITMHVFLIEDRGEPLAFYCMRVSNSDEILINDAIEMLIDKYYKIIKLNLTAHTYDIVKVDDNRIDDVKVKTYDDSRWIKDLLDIENVYWDDIEIYALNTDTQYLMKYFKTHDTLIGKYRHMIGDEYRWVSLDMIKSSEYTDENQVVILYIKDINDECLKEEAYRNKIEYAVYHDVFTGLWNRQKYVEFEKELIDNIKPKTLGVVFIDINELKYFNKTFGNREGDRRIKLIVELMKKTFFENMIFRISGDEFVIFDINCSSSYFFESVSSLKEALVVDGSALAACGYHWSDDISAIDDILSKAENIMCMDKEEYYSNK